MWYLSIPFSSFIKASDQIVRAVVSIAESVRDVMLWIQIDTRAVYHLTDGTDLKIQIL
jgi:hypothetical protein